MAHLLQELKEWEKGQEKARELAEQQEVKIEKEKQLIHQVFKQNPAGRKLLKIWKESLMDDCLVRFGEEQHIKDIGFLSGWQELKRFVIKTCEQVEKQ